MSFLGLTGFYRQYIQNYADIAEPLAALKRKNSKFKWDAFTCDAFNNLKKALITPPILQYPNFEKEFYLSTDASNIAIGAVLSELSDSKDLPIAYASRALNPSERNYPTIKKELLAIIWAIRKFRPYLYGRQFTIVTDHKPLTYLRSMKNASSILLRWSLELEEYTFSIKYCPGKFMKNADALSRIIQDDDDKRIVNVVTRSKSSRLNLPVSFNDSQAHDALQSHALNSSSSFNSSKVANCPSKKSKVQKLFN